MSKPKPAYDSMIDELPDDPAEIVPLTEGTIIPSYDATLPKVRATAKRGISAAGARDRLRKARSKPKPSPDELVQRSIYARAATFDKLKRLAFNKGDPIQEFYREGLLLVLQKYKLDGGMSLDDI